MSKKKKLIFKTIDNTEIMEEILASRNAKYLNEAQGSPFTIE